MSDHQWPNIEHGDPIRVDPVGGADRDTSAGQGIVLFCLGIAVLSAINAVVDWWFR